MDEYKKDETRGRSILQPINYKCDTLVQVWIDARVLATLDQWMEMNGIFPRSFSEVARRPLEMLVETLVSDGLAKMVEETVIARHSLERRYRVKLNKGDRGKKNALHNQILTEGRKELGHRMALGRSSIGDSAMPIVEDTRTIYVEKGDAVKRQELIDKAMKIYNSDQVVADPLSDDPPLGNRDALLKWSQTHSRADMLDHVKEAVDRAEREALSESDKYILELMKKDGKIVEEKE